MSETLTHKDGSYYRPDPASPGEYEYVGPDGEVWGDRVTEADMREFLAEDAAEDDDA